MFASCREQGYGIFLILVPASFSVKCKSLKYKEKLI